MTNTTVGNFPVIESHELSELDEATVSLVMADFVLRERVTRLSTHKVKGAKLRKEIVELMTDIHRLKKLDREFYCYTPPSEDLKDQLHPLQGQRDNVEHIFELMNNTKKEIEESIGSIKDKSNSKLVEQKLEEMLLSFIEETRFYLKEPPPAPLSRRSKQCTKKFMNTPTYTMS